MDRIQNILAAAGAAALLAVSPAATSAAGAADFDPPLPLSVKQRLIELTAAPAAPARGRCLNAEAVQSLIDAAPGYADEITLFAARRLQERPPRADEDCSCLIELARAIGGALPERSTALSRLVADQAPACGSLIIRGIDDRQAAGGGGALDSRAATGGAVARNACATSRTCATPLLRPVSDLIGPTRLGGDS